jgi:predicted phosphodiesterase
MNRVILYCLPNAGIMISTKISYKAVLKTEEVDDLHKYQALPPAVGSYPYRLPLNTCNTENLNRKMVFHIVGDTGGLTVVNTQEKVALQMAAQCYEANDVSDVPAFLYHLGDIAYHYGEARDFEAQFLQPFDCYPAPVYAIAGNHDTDVDQDSQSHEGCLEAFYATFCNASPATIHFAQTSKRKSQVQPNVYWTMESPLAIIIGLHTNVPKYGYINREQKNWFVNELRNAAGKHSDKALIVCMHHAPYSADVNHGSSKTMIDFLDAAFSESGIKPDAVFSGHVHNYQRFSKQYEDGKTIPYIVAGAGGFEELHQLADPHDETYITESDLFEDVHLNSYCDDRHGFLKISIEKTPFNFSIKGAYYTTTGPCNDMQAMLFDEFSIDLTGR